MKARKKRKKKADKAVKLDDKGAKKFFTIASIITIVVMALIYFLVYA